MTRPGTGTWDVTGVRRLLVVGDVQSNYDPLALLLEAAGYLDWDGNRPVWRAGDAVLLFLGDLLDGADQPSEVLWLVTTLDAEARRSGGRVLLLKGNHEELLLGALVDRDAEKLQQWLVVGGLETLVRLAVARGFTATDSLRVAIFTPAFGEMGARSAEVAELCEFVRERYSAELDFLRTRARAAALVNGCLLAVHGAPNFEADGWRSFSSSERDDSRIAWGRAWLSGFRAGTANEPLVARLRELKARLDSEADGIALRHVVFGHTELDDFAVPAFRGRQFRVGRAIPPAPDLPALYGVLTSPRHVPAGGALGGLEFGARSVVACYSNPVNDGDRVWPQREVLGDGDPAFAG